MASRQSSWVTEWQSKVFAAGALMFSATVVESAAFLRTVEQRPCRFELALVALERPDLFVADLREFFGALNSS